MADFWQRLAEGGCRRIVIVAPHPDDEVFGIGGIMTLAAARGLDLTVLAVTDGEASHAGSNRITTDELIERRQGEVLEAYTDLGISPARVRLGLPDAGVLEQSLHEQLLPHVSNSSALLAPLPDDGHPDHDACGRAVAALASERAIMSFCYPVWAYHRTPKARQNCANAYRIALGADALQAKRRAMARFVSQFSALGPAPEDGPVLKAGFEEPFLGGHEVLYF